MNRNVYISLFPHSGAHENCDNMSILPLTFLGSTFFESTSEESDTSEREVGNQYTSEKCMGKRDTLSEWKETKVCVREREMLTKIIGLLYPYS